MEAFKAFIKPFETPQRKVKWKFQLIFSLRLRLGREGLKYSTFSMIASVQYILTSFVRHNLNNVIQISIIKILCPWCPWFFKSPHFLLISPMCWSPPIILMTLSPSTYRQTEILCSHMERVWTKLNQSKCIS